MKLTVFYFPPFQRRNLEARWKRERQTDAANKTRRQQRQLREAELLRQSTGLKGILRNNVDRSSLGSPPGALVADVPLKGGSATFGGTVSNVSVILYTVIFLLIFQHKLCGSRKLYCNLFRFFRSDFLICCVFSKAC